MAGKAKEIWAILKETGSDWSNDNATRLAAALAYYTVLSIAPLLVLAVSIAGLVFGEEAAKGQIASELAGVVGPQAGEGIETVLNHAKSPEKGALGSIIGGIVLLFGASGVFGELQSSLNAIWEVAPKPGRGVWGFLRQRFFSFSMVLGVAFLLLVSLVLSALLAGLGSRLESSLPGGELLWQIVNFFISLGLITGLFALLFKVVPDANVQWRHVWIGAAVTAVLFVIGKFALGLYLGRASVASPYGAAGSIIVLVIWVYYAAQILFLGAEFTQVYARRRGARIEPSSHAVPVETVKKVKDQPEASDGQPEPRASHPGSPRHA
jgi:membrane protein